MATNEILRFAETDTGTNLLTQVEYAADSQRPIGNQPGVARSKLVNKALRQASLIAAGLAEYIADNQANNITDALTPQNIADYLQAAITGALGVTPPQFDNDTSLATTAFVQRALGSFNGVSVLSSATALTAADAGKNIILSGATPFATTLPGTNGLPNGASISIENNASADCTVVRSGADTIAPNASSAISTITIPAGTQISFVKVNAVWYAFGSGAAAYQSNFGSFLGSSGYQKLPSGLIIQWGATTTPANNVAVVVNLPIAWPNFILSGVANPAGLAANVGVFGLQATGGTSKTQISITQGGTSPQGTFWIALGA